MAIAFEPMRSLIYVDVVKEQYRHKLHHWLYFHHIPDSIAQFRPYCTKYAFYNALPTPPGGEAFGTARMQLTEHYWLLNIMDPAMGITTLKEYFPMEALIWQGTMPEDAADDLLTGNESRSTGGDNGMPPFVFAFLPLCWEEEFKGAGRMLWDGPNYRWNFALRYPDGVSEAEGDAWLKDKVIPHFQADPGCTRILTSKVLRHVNNCPMYRVVEMWFDGPDEWHRAAVATAGQIEAPSWAREEDAFPYLKPGFEIRGIFVTDYATCDAYSQYHGYIAMR